jgi:hypothetical protein
MPEPKLQDLHQDVAQIVNRTVKATEEASQTCGKHRSPVRCSAKRGVFDRRESDKDPNEIR